MPTVPKAKLRETLCGIDPGLQGAIAFIERGKLVVYDMPTKAYYNKRKINPEKVARILKRRVDMVLLERAIPMTYTDKYGSRRGQGAAGSFSFGEGYGIIKGVLATLGHPYHEIQPSVWKAKLRLGRDKRESLGMAADLYPEEAGLFVRKKDDGRAEATLLAHLCAEVFQERVAPQAGLAQIL